MSYYVEPDYVESGYVEGDEPSTPSNYDLTVLESKIDSIVLKLNGVDFEACDLKLNNVVNGINAIILQLNNRFDVIEDLISDLIGFDLTQVAKTADLEPLAKTTDLQNLDFNLDTIVLPSLNGNGSEFIDGDTVTVSGRDVVYTVDRSFVSLYSDNGYTVHYDLVATTGHKLTVPEALLTKYIEAV